MDGALSVYGEVNTSRAKGQTTASALLQVNHPHDVSRASANALSDTPLIGEGDMDFPKVVHTCVISRRVFNACAHVIEKSYGDRMRHASMVNTKN
ncbi:Uncharacterised protein [Aeromonas caviae]|nr:Uncharacterised protein [Aeromonas caviae]SQH59627.1 Uncharacterised protein [Aeromonas caviae]SQH59637.1 Uncharacterised protein [Aeromonas caviae]